MATEAKIKRIDVGKGKEWVVAYDEKGNQRGEFIKKGSPVPDSLIEFATGHKINEQMSLL